MGGGQSIVGVVRDSVAAAGSVWGVRTSCTGVGMVRRSVTSHRLPGCLSVLFCRFFVVLCLLLLPFLLSLFLLWPQLLLKVPLLLPLLLV